MCDHGHILKQVSSHPNGKNLSVKCNICYSGNLISEPFFFKCEFIDCDYDMCVYCYHLTLTN
jgi:hypothetical protein